VALRTERPPVRARSGRRPLPPLIFLLVLALAALGVWWNVLRQHEAEVEAQEKACATVEPAPPSLDPATVQVRVHNATAKAGEAQKATIALKDRGFSVVETGNDPTDRTVTGIGEIRYGARGADAAAFLAVFLPGAGDYQDVRSTAVVDLVIGPDYTGLASPEDVAAAFEPATGAAAAC
jgi:hypothetical protein